MTSLLVAGCPDPEGEFCAFDDRYKNINADGSGVGTCESVVIQTSCDECETAATDMDVTGDYLFTLSTSLGPTQPFLFAADVTLDGGSLSIVAQPLDAMDRATPVGDPFTIGPFTLGGGFCLEETLQPIALPGGSNPISGTDVGAEDVILSGSVCGPGDFICGTIPSANALLAGSPIPFTGTWTLERLAAPGMFPTLPTINCEMEQADAL